MSTRLAVEIDGVYVPLDDCDWVLWCPEGCPLGVTVGRLSATEEAAWKALYQYKRDIGKARRHGQHLELMTHERYCREVSPRMLAGCTHPPKGRTA